MDEYPQQQQKQIIIEPTIVIQDETTLLDWWGLVIVPLALGYMAWHRAHKDKDK